MLSSQAIIAPLLLHIIYKVDECLLKVSLIVLVQEECSTDLIKDQGFLNELIKKKKQSTNYLATRCKHACLTDLTVSKKVSIN